MKRLTVALTILALCLQVFSGIAVYGAGEENRIEITINAQNPTSGIEKGDSLYIILSCKNKETEEITDLKAEVLPNSSFSPQVEGPVELLDVLPADGNFHDTPRIIDLVYLGTGIGLTLELSYKVNGVTVTETEKLNLAGLVESEPPSLEGPPSSSPDTSKYIPKLGTTIGNRIPTITAGCSATMTSPVKNDSIYQARNITVTLKMADET
ncbi:MAG: hypothetical protein ACM3XR_00320, partial [Bacillota bacterium]